MARSSTKWKEPDIISTDWILRNRHTKQLTPTDKRHTFFVRLANDQIWEINPTVRPMKALLRSFNASDDTPLGRWEMEQVWPDLWMESICFDIEEFIRDVLKFKYMHKPVYTKFVFGKKPFCQWWERVVYSGYGQQQDIWTPAQVRCMQEAVTLVDFKEYDESGNLKLKEEYRCEKHRMMTTQHDAKTISNLGMLGPGFIGRVNRP